MRHTPWTNFLRVLARSLAIAALVFAPLPHGAEASEAGFRVLHTDIHLTLDHERGLIREQAELRVAGSGITRLTFELSDGLLVERARADRGIVEHRRGGPGLVVDLDPPLDGERTVTFILTGRPRRGSEDLVTERWAALGAEDLWYPSHRESLATARIRIDAPEGWTALGPGRPSGDPGAVWTASRPVRGVAVVAAPGLESSEAELPGTGFRLIAPSGFSAASLADSFRDPMAWFSGALAAYPFDGFNLAIVPGLPFRVRGSGMVALPETAALEGRENAAAVLAGQWFGEYVAGEGAWIRAFEAWQAVTYSRDRSLPLPSEIAVAREAYLDLPAGADVPLARATPSSPDSLLRGKGSAAPDMIRLVVGDRRFYRGVNDLFGGEPGPPRSLDEIRAVFETRAGNPLIRSFSEWFDRRGLPRLTSEMVVQRISDDAWNVELVLGQGPGVWLLPVEVVFVGVDREHRETIRIEDETTRVEYTLPFRPERLEIDPLNRLFLRP